MSNPTWGKNCITQNQTSKSQITAIQLSHLRTSGHVTWCKNSHGTLPVHFYNVRTRSSTFDTTSPKIELAY